MSKPFTKMQDDIALLIDLSQGGGGGTRSSIGGVRRMGVLRARAKQQKGLNASIVTRAGKPRSTALSTPENRDDR